MTVSEFHKQRRMFYCNGSHVEIAPANDERSHGKWMSDTGVGHLYNKVIRGYADETGIYLYKGENFSLEIQDFRPARKAAMIVGLTLRLVQSTPVWGGVIPGQPGTRWRGRMLLGNLKSVAKIDICTTKASTGISTRTPARSTAR